VRLALVLQWDWVADVTTVVRSSPSAAARVPSRVILLRSKTTEPSTDVVVVFPYPSRYVCCG